MENFVDEIKQDLQQEKLIKFLKKNAALLMLAAISVVGITGAITAYSSFEQNKKLQAGEKYFAAAQLISADKFVEAEKILNELQVSSPAGYREITGFALAAKNVSDNKIEAAQKQMQEVFTNTKSADLKAVSALWLANFMLDSGKTDEKVKEKISGLAKENSGWGLLAKENLALNLIKQNKNSEAKILLEEIISNSQTPPALKLRSQYLLTNL